jgi:hypothetical protein
MLGIGLFLSISESVFDPQTDKETLLNNKSNS